MEVSHQRRERFYLKLLFGALLGLLLLIGSIWGGRDLYARWQEKRWVRRAVTAMQNGDDATASPDEISTNPRARSARLRGAERSGSPAWGPVEIAA